MDKEPNSVNSSSIPDEMTSKFEAVGIQETGYAQEQQSQITSLTSENNLVTQCSEDVEHSSEIPFQSGNTHPVFSDHRIDLATDQFKDDSENLDAMNSASLSENVPECTESTDNNNFSDLPKGDNPSDNRGVSDSNVRTESDSDSDGDSEDEYLSAEEDNGVTIDEQAMLEIEKTLTEEEKNERRKEGQVHKEEGNRLFKEQNYKEAVKSYGKALRICPMAFPKDRAIMYSNRAACWLKLEQNDQAIVDSTSALDLHPHYLKALLRRAQLYEKENKLDEALADYQRVVELDPSERSAREACMKLPELIKERNEKMKEEMMGKLKDIGNMILRPFGLSTNNFQFQQNADTGGYSVQFQQNPDNGK